MFDLIQRVAACEAALARRHMYGGNVEECAAFQAGFWAGAAPDPSAAVGSLYTPTPHAAYPNAYWAGYWEGRGDQPTQH